EISFLRKGSSSDDFENEVGTVLGLKGANGSGKTNILKAISFLYSFCTKRMNTRGDETEAGSEVLIPFETFFQYE
ncbi:AAA family ATPase, partial [Vibrio harveyi]|uniref:AAA family ATPase n=1 Tax=Vibrio harveyi TaxID=669 RepID=UPI000B25D46A